MNSILGISKKGGILKVGTTMKMLCDVKQFWWFAKGEAENKEHQTAGEKREERKTINKEIKNFKMQRRFLTVYTLKEKLRNSLLIMLYFSLPIFFNFIYLFIYFFEIFFCV